MSPEWVVLLPMESDKRNTYTNRDISWVAFNGRVLQEAEDESVPLIERLRFLGIFSNNLDEFYRVRVATWNRMASLGKRTLATLEFDPIGTLLEIRRSTLRQQASFDRIFKHIVGELAKQNVSFVNESEVLPEHESFIKDYFNEKVRSRLVPIMLDTKSKFPDLKDSAIYLAIRLEIESRKTPMYAICEIPSTLSRFVVLPSMGKQRFVMFIDDLIRQQLKKVFGIFPVTKAEAYMVKVIRDAELDIDDDISKSLMEKMERSVSRRKRGSYVRYIFDKEMPADLNAFFQSAAAVSGQSVIPGGRYHNRRDLMRFPDFNIKKFVFPGMMPLAHHELNPTNILDQVRKKDFLLHFPYHRFSYVADMIREAAIDPAVRTIRISIYRVAGESHVVNALISAARNGKNVVAIIELAARFDENNNMKWSRRLQESGARVFIGTEGLKTHCKLLLISRKEGGEMIRYAYVGTGNFHEKTSLIYTDFALLTSNLKISSEVQKVFQLFEEKLQRSVFKSLLVSPINSRRRIMKLINGEVKNARKGKEAWIKIKLNNLVDAGLIKILCVASGAGVKIQLIVRGTCSLIPGIKGVSENIEVISIVGRFLEHSRMMMFANGGKPKYFLSSMDWMTRNLDHRIEVAVPVYDLDVQSTLDDLFTLQWNDNVKARIIDKKLGNKYVPVLEGMARINSQQEIYKYFKRKLKSNSVFSTVRNKT